MEALGRILNLNEYAVDAVAYAEALFERFEVYVGRPALYGLGYELVDVADYGGLFLGDSGFVAGRERVGGGARRGKGVKKL